MKLKKRIALSLRNSLRFIPDEAYMKMCFKMKLHYEPDFEHPKTFNEKIQWSKLHYHNPELTMLADKYSVRSFVEERIGTEYLVPLYGVFDSVDDIDLDKLPEKFVLKCTHDSQSTFVCTDKAKFNFNEAKKRLRTALNRNWFWQGREWAYKGITPRVVAEAYLDEPGRETPTDYKFYCFDGKAALVQTDVDRFTAHDMQYFTPDWEPRGDINHEVSDRNPTIKPENYDLMLALAGKLATGFPHVRVDFYNIAGKPYFGEMTFYTGGGFDPFYMEEVRPDRLDRGLGDLFRLPYEDSAASCGATLVDEQHHQERSSRALQPALQSESQTHASDSAPNEAGV